MHALDGGVVLWSVRSESNQWVVNQQRTLGPTVRYSAEIFSSDRMDGWDLMTALTAG